MEVIYLLVPLSVGLALIILAIFAWAIRSAQFEDLEREGQRILENDEFPTDPQEPNRQLSNTD